MLVIACAGVIGWLLILAVTLCLGAAAKRGDELELGLRRYPLPYFADDAETVSFERTEAAPSCSSRRRLRQRRTPW